MTESKSSVEAFRKMLKGKGYKVSVRFQSVPQIGSGYLVTLVDPADANDICFARWYSIVELDLIRRANEIFWRYVI